MSEYKREWKYTTHSPVKMGMRQNNLYILNIKIMMNSYFRNIDEIIKPISTHSLVIPTEML